MSTDTPRRCRPSKYTEELAKEIYERISAGETVRQVAAEPRMPSHRCIYDWLDKDELTLVIDESGDRVTFGEAFRRAVRSAGRPSIYNEELAREICERVAEGETITKMVEDEHMPCRAQVYAWARQPDKTLIPKGYAESITFGEAMRRAREDQACTYVDEIIDFSNDAMAAESMEQIQAAKVGIDARKWVAGRYNKAFRDTVRKEVTGKDGGPITVKELMNEISSNPDNSPMARLREQNKDVL